MSDFVYYVSKVSIAFALLYSIYYFLFRKLTFHGMNRFILMMILLLSFILPLLKFKLISSGLANIVIPKFNEFANTGKGVVNEGKSMLPGIDVSRFLLYIYFTGVLVVFIRLIKSSFKLIRLKQKAAIVVKNDYYLLKTDVNAIFSCFNWIFIPANKLEGIDEHILEHEKTHIKLHHTFDLLLTEIYIAFFWFNPFVYFFRKTIKSVHEFQVDSIIIKSDIKKSHYMALILNNLEIYKPVDLYNYFYGTTIKKRIHMITKNKSSKFHSLKYLLLIPAIALLTMSFKTSKSHIPRIFPITQGQYDRISAKYGEMYNPFGGKKRFHTGIDIAAKIGTLVHATAEGTVIKAGYEEGWGKLVVIDHGNGIQSWYAHLDGIKVKENQSVDRDQVIGTVGETGKATGPHLHFEIHKNGKPVNPAVYIK